MISMLMINQERELTSIVLRLAHGTTGVEGNPSAFPLSLKACCRAVGAPFWLRLIHPLGESLPTEIGVAIAGLPGPWT